MINPKDNELQDLISVPQVVTGSWVDLGVEPINVKDINSIGLWFKIDINDSADFRIRMVAILGSDVYVMPIRSVAAAKVTISPEYYELSDDADQNVVIDFPIVDMLEIVKFQIQAGTPGTTGAITSAKIAFNEKEAHNA